jgi:hypothetical protein
MEANSAGGVGTGAKKDESITGRVWAAGVFIMLRPVLACPCFETYEPIISLVFHFFFGPQLTADTESVDAEHTCVLFPLFFVYFAIVRSAVISSRYSLFWDVTRRNLVVTDISG